MYTWILIQCVVIVLSYTFAAVCASRRLMHYFQLESYQFRGYFKTLLRQWKKAFLPYTLLFALLLALILAIQAVHHLGWESVSISGYLDGYEQAPTVLGWLHVILSSALLPCVFAVLGGIHLRRRAIREKEKKKFALTARMKRLYAVHTIFLLALLGLVYGAVFNWFAVSGSRLGLGSMNSVAILAAFGAPTFLLLSLIVALSAVIALPIERLIFHLYFRDAEKKLLENPRLIRIGITGSYGKTSTKFILAEILSQKFNVLATPASFNTPMGVTRIIRERLTPSHQIFIGEMGARHVGEIKELSRLVHPTIGILTAVGPQHLDTFKTLERIEKTKYELIDALPGDGLGVFLHDDAIVTKLYDKTEKPKLLVGKENADAWATDVSVSPQGSHFTLHLKGWEPFQCTTALLGEHNIRNILMASAVAKYLGLNKEQISRGIAQLKPIEHRLQLMKTAGGVAVIDDAFNTNPRSSKEALKVLSSFPGRRVIVTPGMVELGAEEAKYNEEFGQAMASAVDVAVLVGRHHTEPIKKGLTEAGFPAESIHTVANLDEAIRTVNGILRPGDVVMYENDLPDNYNEG